jgi:hypothetical protein
MTETDYPIQNFTKWTQKAHMVERILQEATAFKGSVLPFNSANIQTAYNEARYARMFGGDCLRLLIQGHEARSNKRFVPAEYGATFDTNPIPKLLEMADEMSLISDLKLNLRLVLYDVLDFEEYLSAHSYNVNEFFMYKTAFAMHLKQADQNLGLRLGELRGG